MLMAGHCCTRPVTQAAWTVCCGSSSSPPSQSAQSARCAASPCFIQPLAIPEGLTPPKCAAAVLACPPHKRTLFMVFNLISHAFTCLSNVKIWLQQGDTPLHYASAQSHAEVISALAKAGSPLELQDKVSGWSLCVIRDRYC